MWFVIGFVSFTVIGFTLGYFLVPDGPKIYSIPAFFSALLIGLALVGPFGWSFATYRYRRQTSSISDLVGVPMLFGLLVGPGAVVFASMVPFSPELTTVGLIRVFLFFSFAGTFCSATFSAYFMAVFRIALRGRFQV
jgi:hypothetical protein